MTTPIDIRDVLTANFFMERKTHSRDYSYEDAQSAFLYVDKLVQQDDKFNIPEIVGYLEPVRQFLQTSIADKKEALYRYVDHSRYPILVGIIILYEALMAYEARVQVSV